MFDIENYEVPETAVAHERRVQERKKALENLEVAKQKEKKLLEEGRKYKQINKKTFILKK